MEKIIVVILGQNCEKYITMCLESVRESDKIIYCDGGSIDDTFKIIDNFFLSRQKEDKIIKNKWNPEDKQMNGKQRNFYLKYLKENYPDDWCLALDADEVVEDLGKIKEFIQNAEGSAWSVKMRHFIGDLGHEDNTHQTHFVPKRLFKISCAKGYPLHSHPILEHDGIQNIIKLRTEITTIWHLGHLPVDYMRYIVKRTKQHKEDSIIHNQQFLDWWGKAHLFGEYPTRKVNPREIPKIIYDGLGIDYNEIYSSQEQIEFKHHIMVKQWRDYFMPKSVLDLGCGRGTYLFYWDWWVPMVKGIDKNKWAVDNSFVLGRVDLGECDNINDNYELITAIDLLEHLDDDKLNKTLGKMAKYGNKFLFSIPFIGDPNLEADSTHIQKHTKEKWIEIIENHGIKVKTTPDNWLFKEQILVGEI
jgi:SAM-dependent methyltransferase